MRIQRVRILVLVVLILASCIFLGVKQNPQERPFKISGDLILTIDLTTCSPPLLPPDFLPGPSTVCSAEREDWGNATHLGLYSSSSSDTKVNLYYGYVSGTGVMTAANGDQLYWKKDGDSLTITGGTGRFENATGAFETSRPAPTVTQPNPFTLVVTHPFSGSGTITY